MDKSYNYLNGIVNDNDYVVIALSGGPDSMALLHLFIRLRKEKNINIICAHVNHGLRIESEEEKIFVEEYCKANNIVFEYMKIESYENGFNEKDARIKRYEFFDRIMTKYNSNMLFTAHHGDDLIETILMRIGRGSNLKGYSGFSILSIRHGYNMIKPLVYYTKKDIMTYVEANNIPYVIDNTNDKDEYTRNRYRHNVLPFLKEENKDVHLKYLKYSQMLLEYDSYVEKVALSKMSDIYTNNILDLNYFKKLALLIQKRILNIILYSIYGDNITCITDVHTSNIFDLINSSRPNVNLQLPDDVIILKEYDKLSFDYKSDKKGYKYVLDKDLEIGHGKFIFEDEEESNTNFVCRLNSNDIRLPLIVRSRLDGDKIEIKNLNGSKKVKDIFIDVKLDKSKRDIYPIVTDSNNNIVWIPGVKKSKYDKEKYEKCDIIIKYVLKEEK